LLRLIWLNNKLLALASTSWQWPKKRLRQKPQK